MKKHLHISMLTRWFILNGTLTICFGLFLAAACLFPAIAPSMRLFLGNEVVSLLLPYIIFSLIVSALLSISFFVDSRWD